jgi:hypothetical protein
MTIYVNEKCRKCGTSLTGWVPDYRAIGVPFAKCEKCGVFNDRSDKANEWDLMDGGRKAVQIMLIIYYAFGWALVLLLPISWIAFELNPALQDESIFQLKMLIYLTPALLLSFSWHIYSFNKEIKKSKERLANEKYRSVLIKLGLMNG